MDFDNTIVSYDALFHKAGIEQALIPPDVAANKLAVRDYLRANGQEDAWTELQGYVYGARMDEAIAYDGVIAFCLEAYAGGHELFIISHKTRHPFLGPQHDLHAAARDWIGRHLTFNGGALVPTQRVFFELTKVEKIARIVDCQCDVYIDDLPEILSSPDFPKRTARLLFDPERRHGDATANGMRVFSSWQSLDGHLYQ